MTDIPDTVVTFSVMGGIFGVGRLASRLKALESINLIGSWYVDDCIDYTHNAIRIRFDNVADAKVAILKVGVCVDLPRQLLRNHDRESIWRVFMNLNPQSQRGSYSP